MQGFAVLFNAVFLDEVVGNHGAADEVGVEGVRFVACRACVEDVVAASFDGADAGECAAAGTGCVVGNQNVIEAVADDGLAFAVEVGNDGGEAAAFAVYPVFFDIDHVFVQMQVAVGAGVGEEAFGALVDLVNWRAEALFDAGFDLRL